VKIPIVNKSINPLPEYANPGDAGLDLRADFSGKLNDKFFHFADFDEVRQVLLIFPGGRALVPTNLLTAIPEGYEVQIRPRSGLALREGITVLNTPGTIDAPFRNGWGIIIINLGEEVFEIAQGDRIAQAVLNKFEKIEWEPVDVLPESKRGLTGFGDSGIK
jgi:dUTP pyrophosphatase